MIAELVEQAREVPSHLLRRIARARTREAQRLVVRRARSLEVAAGVETSSTPEEALSEESLRIHRGEAADSRLHHLVIAPSRVQRLKRVVEGQALARC